MMLESLSAGCFCVHLSDRSSIPQLSLDTNRSPGYLSRVDRHRRERSPKQFPRRFFSTVVPLRTDFEYIHPLRGRAEEFRK